MYHDSGLVLFVNDEEMKDIQYIQDIFPDLDKALDDVKKGKFKIVK